jgi:hypothetical protein
VAVAGQLVLAAGALAAPRWGVEVSHRNAYGAQEEGFGAVGGTCAPERLEAKLCGVDPYTGSATSFDRESGFNTYAIVVKNVGETAVKKELPEGQRVTLEDELPEGLAVAGPPAALAFGAGWKECHVTNEKNGGFLKNANGEPRPRLVKCVRSSSATELAPGASYPPVTLHVYVEGEAKDLVTNTATAAGGEASPSSTSQNDPTEIAPAVRFGIDCFSMADLSEAPPAYMNCAPESAAKPEAQAGGHPFALTTNLTFNFSTSFEGKLLSTGSGPDEFGVSAKEVEVELPPGLIGDPQNFLECPLRNFLGRSCSPNAAVGYIHFNYTHGSISSEGKPQVEPNATSYIYNVTPPPGHPAAFGFITPQTELPLLLYPKLLSNGEYRLAVGDEATGPLRIAQVTFCGFGTETPAEGKSPACSKPTAAQRPFISNPTRCGEAPTVRVRATPYPTGSSEADGEAAMETYLNGPSGPPAFAGGPESKGVEGAGGSSRLSGCEALGGLFEPTLEFEPSPPAEGGTGRPGAPSAMTLKLEQPEGRVNPSCSETHPGIVECPPISPELKKLEMTLPEGVSLSPASATPGPIASDGLHACSDAQFAQGSSEPAGCPLSSQVGTVEVTSPDLPKEADGSGQLKGALYVGQPECGVCSEADASSGRLFRLFLELRDAKAGLDVKLSGHATPNLTTGRVTTTFDDQPQLPFERLVLHLKGGPRGVLTNPESCSAQERTLGRLTPWSAEPGNEAQTRALSVPFAVECPSGVPFSPSFTAGTAHPAAGQFSAFSLTVERGADDERDLEGLEVHMPPGLTAKIAGVPLCPEAQANGGTCGPESQIGAVTVAVGVGGHPLYEHGRAYLTGPYKGGPFGLSIVVPTTAGPFTLAGNTQRGEEVVRAAIEVDERTAAVTVKSDPIPQILGGVPLKVAKLNVNIERPSFELNPTNCAPRSAGITANLGAAAGAASHPAAVPFDVGGCRVLRFKPSFTASTQAKTSRTEGASLTVKVTQRPPGEADIQKTDLQLPSALPSRLTTLQHACTEAQFAAAPEGKDCPAQSFVGTAKAATPLLSVPLSGPAVLVSHGGLEFPDLHFLLQGEGVKIDLVGHTQIKHGITYSRFEEVPDTPITSFETSLPEGPHSLLASNGNLCTQALTMPTTIVAQNGAEVLQQTKVSVTGCPPHKVRPGPGAKLRAALRACREKDKGHRGRRLACERKAHRRYGGARRSTAARARASASGPSSSAAADTSSSGASGAGGPAAGVQGSASAAIVSAAEPGSCPNEARRAESGFDQAVGLAYSATLPECRAFELVSPVEKQGHDVLALTVVSGGGDAAGFNSEGDFAEPSNFREEGATVRNSYVARRSETGCPAGAPACWTTVSAFAPAGLIQVPLLGARLASDFSPDLSSHQIGCGIPRTGVFACAAHKPDGSWAPTPFYWPAEGLNTISSNPEADFAQSADLTHVFLEPGVKLLPQDVLQSGGLYEVSAVGSAAPQLRLVNMDEGHELPYLAHEGSETPLLGDSSQQVDGTAYHAVSEDGGRVFFTAEPAGGGVQSIFARVPCATGPPRCESLEDGAGPIAGSGRETLDLSRCTAPEPRCEPAQARPATFQGASADGSKVFFTTDQQLSAEDKNATTDLYEYDFETPGEPLKLLSQGKEAAEVRGVVRVASDGSRVYFVADGVLSTEPNAFGESASPGPGRHLYSVDTGSGHVSFIATLAPGDKPLWGQGCPLTPTACDSEERGQGRPAQTTPDGAYLVFATKAKLGSENTNGCKATPEEGVAVCAPAVYLFDAQTESLTWISHASPGFTGAPEGYEASIELLPGNKGATADFSDAGRAITGCPEPPAGEALEGCEHKGRHDGEYVVFETREALQAGHRGGDGGVYMWHCAAPCSNPKSEGTVALISAGAGAAGDAAISATGRDVFFTTGTALVPQDSDELDDVYDARIGGGIAMQSAPSCAGEGCQGGLSGEPLFAPPGSAIFSGGQNLAPSPPPAAVTAAASASRKRPTNRHRHRPAHARSKAHGNAKG